MSNQEYLLSLITIEDPEIVSWALTQLSQNTQRNWFWYFDQLPALEAIPSRYPALANQTHLLLSRIHFFADDLPSALDSALEAGDLFDPSHRDLYVDSILALMVTTYIDSKKNEVEDFSEEELSRLSKIQKVVEKVLGKSFGQGGPGENLLLLGLAIETRDFSFFVKLLKQTGDRELDSMFGWLKGRVFEPVLKNKLLGMFLEEFRSREGRFLMGVSQCLFQMGKVEEHADFILEMTSSNNFLRFYF